MIGWLLRKILDAIDAPDTAWKATGVRYTTPRHHDEALASAAYKRAQTRTETGRVIPRPKKASPAKVVPMRRKDGTR